MDLVLINRLEKMNTEHNKIILCIESSKIEKHFEACERLIYIFVIRWCKYADIEHDLVRLSTLQTHLFYEKKTHYGFD